MLVFMSCDVEQHYKYAEPLYDYFSEVHNQDFRDFKGEQKIVILTLSGCSPCVKDVMNSLINTYTDDTMLLAAGTSTELVVSNMLSQLQQIYPMMLDPENLLIKYRANISGPTLVYFSKSLVEATELKVNNMSMIFEK